MLCGYPTELQVVPPSTKPLNILPPVKQRGSGHGLADGKSVYVIFIVAVSEWVTDFVCFFLMASEASASAFEEAAYEHNAYQAPPLCFENHRDRRRRSFRSIVTGTRHVGFLDVSSTTLSMRHRFESSLRQEADTVQFPTSQML